MKPEIKKDGKTYLTIGGYARRYGIGRYQAEKIWAETPGTFQDGTHAYIPADLDAFKRRTKDATH